MISKKIELRKFLSYYKPYKGLLAADIICAALTAALALTLPMCVRHITRDIIEVGAVNATTSIIYTGLLMLVIVILQTAVALFYDYKGHDMGAKIERNMRAELFTHFQKLSFGFYDNQKTGQLMSRLTNDLLNLAELYHHGPENLIIYSAQVIGASIILLYINPKLTLVVFLFLPVMAIYSFVFYGKLRIVYKKNHEHIADINAQTEENLSGNRVVKSFVNEELEIKKFSEKNNIFYRSRSRIYKYEALHYTVMEKFLTQLITISIVVFGGIWIQGNSLELPDLLIFIMYAAYMTAPIPKLAFMVQQYQEGLAGYRRFREIMDTTPDIQDTENAVCLKNVKGRVEFANVSFKYNEDQENILQNINLDVSAGERIAIVGHSGVGKTTMCWLIPRFYEVIDGEIRIDGVNIYNATLQSLRHQIGIVQQENFLFAGTVAENILYGNPNATTKEVIVAAKRANAHEFIMSLPNGYETYIGQRGLKLSGGQKQRLCIARVFLKDPPILIFDEATSNLDYESEKIIMESLTALTKGRTSFIIAHRLSTVRNADRIVVLSNNGISEQGTHDELLALEGTYAMLYKSQGN